MKIYIGYNKGLKSWFAINEEDVCFSRQLEWKWKPAGEDNRDSRREIIRDLRNKYNLYKKKTFLHGNNYIESCYRATEKQ